MNHVVNDVTYNISKLGVFDQLKVARRLAPVLSGIREAFKASKPKMVPSETDPEKLVPVITLENLEIGPIADALSGMKDEDVDAIVKVCLKAVKRKGDGGFASILEPTSGIFMFDDIDLPTAMNLTFHVISESLGGFFLTAQQKSTSELPK